MRPAARSAPGEARDFIFTKHYGGECSVDSYWRCRLALISVHYAPGGRDVQAGDDLEKRLSRLEKQSRTIVILLSLSTIGAVAALAFAVWAVTPMLPLRHALQVAALHSQQAPIKQGAVLEGGGAPPKSNPAPEPEDDNAKLLSALDLRVSGKKLIPRDYEAGRYSAEVELTCQGKNNSDRKVRAYQGSLEVTDTLGNEIISLKLTNESPLGAHETGRFTRYWEINQFIDSNTRFAAEEFENLRFVWTAEKIVFSDGTTIDRSN